MNSSKKSLNRRLKVNIFFWLAMSSALIIIEYYEFHSIKSMDFIISFIFPALLIVPMTIVNLRHFHRDKNISVFFDNGQINVTKNEKKLTIEKQNIKKIKLYHRFFIADLIIDLNNNVRFCISNSHDDFKETLNKLRSWDVPIRYI
jgi:hypothetical protein